MRPELQAVAATQSGLVTRTQAKDRGYSERNLRSLLTGAWTTVRRGVYMETELWEELGDPERRIARDLAADLRTTSPHVLSHDSAAHLLGLEFLEAGDRLSHVTRKGVTGCRTDCGVKHHLSRQRPGELVATHGTLVTGWARTAVDLGREHGFRIGATAADAALRHGVRRSDLEAEVAKQAYWPGVTQARAAVEFADPGADGVGETLARELVVELGLEGELETQFPVRTSKGTYWSDLRLGCHLVEFDGRLKYRRRAEGGVAEIDGGDVLWKEKDRQRLVCAEGLGMSRIIWADFWGAEREVAKYRLAAEFALTVRRHGLVLPPHLRRIAADERRRRAARAANAA